MSRKTTNSAYSRSRNSNYMPAHFATKQRYTDWLLVMITKNYLFQIQIGEISKMKVQNDQLDDI
jgi:hypothetical protein